MPRVHCIIHGAVQGVGFRYHAQRCARELSLNGWVRNLRRGQVETEVEGPRPALESYLEQMREGPGFSRVERVEETWEGEEGSGPEGEPARYGSYEIRPTI